MKSSTLVRTTAAVITALAVAVPVSTASAAPQHTQATPASAAATFFVGNAQRTAFASATAGRGLSLDVVQDFTGARFGGGILLPDRVALVTDPLDHTSNGTAFPAGRIAKGVRFQSNLDAFGLNGPRREGNSSNLFVERGASVVGRPGSTVSLSSATPANSVDILSLRPGHRAAVVDLSAKTYIPEPGFPEPGQFQAVLHVFDTNGSLIGRTLVREQDLGTFVGVVVDGGEIGRVNLTPTTSNFPDTAGYAEALYGVQLYKQS